MTRIDCFGRHKLSGTYGFLIRREGDDRGFILDLSVEGAINWSDAEVLESELISIREILNERLDMLKTNL